MAWIDFSINKTLTRESWKNGYDYLNEVHQKFPGIKIKGKSLVDPWGTPYLIQITHSNATFNLQIRSAGRDRQFGTRDDQTRGYDMPDEIPPGANP